MELVGNNPLQPVSATPAMSSLQRLEPAAATGVLPLTGTKQSSGLVAREVKNVGCLAYSGHWAPSTQMAQRDRPLAHHLDWWNRTKAVRLIDDFATAKSPFKLAT